MITEYRIYAHFIAIVIVFIPSAQDDAALGEEGRLADEVLRRGAPPAPEGA